VAFLTIALAGSGLATTTTARADDAAVAEAQERFREGLELADASKHDAARLKFQQAWAVFKAPTVLFNLARSEQLTGHDLEAMDHFRQFVTVSANDSKITDAMREKAKQNVAELARKVAQIEVEAPSTARISVDGKPVDAPPGPRETVIVAPGRHTVEATLDGRRKSVTVECTAGATTLAHIEIEGTAGGYTPPAGGETTTPASVIVPAVIGVVGLAGIGFGVGFALSSQSAKDDSEAIRRETPGVCAPVPSARCGEYDDKRSDAESAATMSYVSYVAGGALIATAIVTYLVWPKKKLEAHPEAQARRGALADGGPRPPAAPAPAPRATMIPTLGAGLVGAGLAGTF